jgi:hypothetical protein
MIFYVCPAVWTCASSPFIYNPAGHVIAVDLNIINNTSLRDVFAKEPKFVQDFLFRKCGRDIHLYVGLSSELSIPNSFIKQSTQCDLHTKTILLGAL